MRTAIFVLMAGLTGFSAEARADAPLGSRQFIGRTQAAASAEVRARVTGSVNRVAVKAGDAVAKGDLLIEIDPRPYKLDLNATLARVKAAEARLQATRIKAANDRRLQEKKVIGADQIALSAAEEAEAEAMLTLAKVEAEQAQLTLSWTNVAAPIDGRVSRIQVAEGDLVTAEGTPVLTVVSTDRLRVCFNVPESMLLQLRRDGLADPAKLSVTVGFAGEEGFPHTATMELIEPVVNIKTGSVGFQATVPNPKELLSPGMSARVLLTPQSK